MAFFFVLWLLWQLVTFFSPSVFRLEVSVRGTSGEVWEQLYVRGLVVRTGVVNCGLLADWSLAPPSGWGEICA